MLYQGAVNVSWYYGLTNPDSLLIPIIKIAIAFFPIHNQNCKSLKNTLNTSSSSGVAEPIANFTNITGGQFVYDSLSFVQTVTAAVTDGKYEFSYNKPLGEDDYIELSLPTFDTSGVHLIGTDRWKCRNASRANNPG